ncbi:peptidyl-prolyl cis-trans isomerase, EpsD family [Rubrivivax gelatinosus]|uniref:EpsD family peptidyl-prolyl cis-trans isomerase n=1 Tax=Rubrivivax gelatinosus TaxID=28068 RepID=UPI00190640A2|nr:EpsD family peptidyl-prolyl cis-trans isomerase [Rubrivivax gelatinosus]MBK1615209.1 peptidyl-prolyl cis-trans isomerase, EpsD family [Rubrivivax gelatinosus]
MHLKTTGGTNPRPRLAATTLALAVVIVAGCGGNRESASQTAARVNKDDITVHQINFVLQQQRGVQPGQAEVVGRQILERLIDQQLALQKADDLKLDRDPKVVQQLESARRDVLARAYLEKISEGVPRPTPQEIHRYYEDEPALFRERRVYSLQELVIEASPEQAGELKARLNRDPSLPNFVEHLKQVGLRYTGSQVVRGAEQLPLANVKAFARMQPGSLLTQTVPAGLQVIAIVDVRDQPVDEKSAGPAIEQFILNDRKRSIVEDNLKAMRAQASIEYVGKFAKDAPAAAAPASAPAPAPAASADALDASAIGKGLGIK